MKRVTPEDNAPMSLRECLIAYVAALPTHEDGHPTEAERDELLHKLRNPQPVQEGERA